MAGIDWNAEVKEALSQTDIMALSTIGPDGPWTSPVQYTYNEKLELSFVSMMDARHVANLLKDPRVSVAIFNCEEPGETRSGSLGLQIRGRAVHLSPQDGLSGGWNSFKIIPDEVWLFDSRKLGRKRLKVDLKGLNLA